MRQCIAICGVIGGQVSSGALVELRRSQSSSTKFGPHTTTHGRYPPPITSSKFDESSSNFHQSTPARLCHDPAPVRDAAEPIPSRSSSDGDHGRSAAVSHGENPGRRGQAEIHRDEECREYLSSSSSPPKLHPRRAQTRREHDSPHVRPHDSTGSEAEKRVARSISMRRSSDHGLRLARDSWR